MMPCLQEAELRQVLAGNGTLQDQQRWIEHLDSCATCQTKLEQLAAPPTHSFRLKPTTQVLSIETIQSLYRLGGTKPDSSSSESYATQDIPLSQFLTPSQDKESIGRFGDYEVLGVLGSGGMGLVFKAVEPVLDRVVAIKILSPHGVLSESGIARFLSEARAAAQIEHPNVVGIHQVAQLKGTPYIVMPCIEGESLAEQISNSGKLNPDRAIKIAIQVCEALHAAHCEGIVHRDIKPGNLLIEQATGRVKVSDFGLARAADDPSLTRTGFVAGTPQFMSPEQARGEPVDQRSDLFSLGAVLYTMLVGTPPFDAEQTLSVVHKVIHETPPSVSVALAAGREENTPTIPQWLDRVVGWAMSKDPAARPQNAEALRTALLLQSDSSIQLLNPPGHPIQIGSRTRGASNTTPTFGNARQLGALVAFAALLFGLWYSVQWMGRQQGTDTDRSLASVPAQVPGDDTSEISVPPKNVPGSSQAQLLDASAAITVQNSEGIVAGYERLEEALAQTRSDATITIRRAGIHLIASTLFKQLEPGAEIEIRNGIVNEGKDPNNAVLIHCTPDALPWHISNAKLTLIGFRISQSSESGDQQESQSPENVTKPFFQLEQGSLVLDACTIQHNDSCIVLDAGSELRVERTLLATLGSEATVRARFDRDTVLSVSDSLVIGRQMILLDTLDGVGGELNLRDSTWYGDQLIEVQDDAARPTRPVPLRVEARGNIFQVRYLLAASHSDLGNIAKREIHAQSQLQKLIRWRGDYNLFSIRDSYHGFQLPRKGVISGRAGFMDLASWREFCSAEGEASAEAATSVLRSNLNPSEMLVGDIDPIQFEMARDASISKFGANVRTIGPAALLER